MRFLPILAAAGLLLTTGCASPESERPAGANDVGVVEVRGGLVRGALAPGTEVRSYKGIPFAAAPVGALRWRPPQPPAAWDGVLDATSFAPACLQSLRAEGSFYGQIVDEMSEDCLYLNVWTAAEPGAADAVMVWIHGGGLTSGHGGEATYDGSALAKRGVVVVTLNYRLGALGYLTHPLLAAESQHDASGNYGILDQVAALEWVRDNIAAFGGDPDRVTIFGESAGSWSVNYLQATPLAAGLFHRAIGESGGGFGTLALAYARQEMEAVGRRFVETLLPEGTPVSTEAMRAVKGEDVIATRSAEGRFSVNIDGWVLPASIQDIFARGQQHDVPLIVGSNADEDATLGGGRLEPMTLDAYRTYAVQTFGDLADRYLELYPATTPDETVGARIASATDQRFGWEMRTWARMMGSVPSSAYYYFFSRVPPGPDSARNGAYHAGEIIYVFDNLGRSPYPYANQDYEEIDARLSNQLASYWVNFAKTGDPNGPDLPTWPAYTVDNDQALEFGDVTMVRTGVRRERLDFVEEYFADQGFAGSP